MNPNNQKENPAGLKNRNDQLGKPKASKAQLEAMTGPELLQYIQALANEIQTANALNSQLSTLNR